MSLNDPGQSPVFERALIWWTDAVFNRAKLSLFLITLLTAISLYYTATHLSFKTDTNTMLSEDLPFRQAYTRFQTKFPQFKDDILIVIDGNIPEMARDGVNRLYSRLQTEKTLFQDVYRPAGGPFFEKHGLMYLSRTKLEELADNLAEIQPFLGKLTRDMSLRGLVSMLDSAAKARIDGTDIELKKIFGHMHDAIEAELAGNPYRLSWEELMLGDHPSGDGRRRFILAQPRLDYGRMLAAEPAMSAIRTMAHDLELDADHGVRVRMTGGLALGYEELVSVSKGATLTGFLAMLLVVIVLFVGMRSMRLVAITLLALLSGLILTAGFATLAIGHLNLISAAFAVLYIGLGVDYAIHLCLRFQELGRTGRYSVSEALKASTKDVGVSLILCAITTSIGFYSFVPTAYAGVSELGIISGTGIFISLFVTMTVLPAMFGVWQSPKLFSAFGYPSKPRFQSIVEFPIRHRYSVRVGIILLGLIALWLLPRTTFNYNPVDLRDQSSESVTTFNDLMKRSATTPWRTIILAPDAATARQYEHQLKGLDVVDKVVSIFDLVPGQQDEKVAIIGDMQLIMGELPRDDDKHQPPTIQEQLASLERLRTRLDQYSVIASGMPEADVGQKLRDSIDRFLLRVKSSDRGQQRSIIEHLEDNLLHTMPENLARLQTSLQATSFTIRDLPKSIVDRWLNPDGTYRLEVFPKENISINAALRRFVTQVQKIVPDATGTPSFTLGAGDAVVGTFAQAFLTALAAIFIFLLLLLRSIKDSILIVAPLLLASALICAASVALDIPFNFANIIALPLLMGMGVDNGIHMVQRAHLSLSEGENLLHTSTARAVVFSALTTICGFGSLAFSPHAGTASMGQMLTIGIVIILTGTLVVRPAFLTK